MKREISNDLKRDFVFERRDFESCEEKFVISKEILYFKRDFVFEKRFCILKEILYFKRDFVRGFAFENRFRMIFEKRFCMICNELVN